MKATINRYLEDKSLGINGVGRRGSEATLRAYRTQLNNVERWLKKPVYEVTRSDIGPLFQMVETLELSDRTYNLLLTACRNFMKWALHNGYEVGMPENYFMDVTNLTIQQDENPPLINEEQFHELCETIVRNEQKRKEESLTTDDRTANFGWQSKDFSTKYILALSMMFYGGCRISEAISLKKEDVLEDGVKVVGKGNKERFVPLPKWLLEDLNRYIETHKFGPYVFYGETGRSFRREKTKPLNPTTLYEIFSEARQDMGLPEEFTPHNLRHSFGTMALRSTKRLEIVQELLGHSNPASTRIYAKVLKDDLLEEYSKIFA